MNSFQCQIEKFLEKDFVIDYGKERKIIETEIVIEKIMVRKKNFLRKNEKWLLGPRLSDRNSYFPSSNC